MMDVLLVNPRHNGRSEIPPLGLLSIAAPLLERGVQVSILDLDLLNETEAEASLNQTLEIKKPSIVGVTSLSDSFESAITIFRTVKCRNTDIMTVLGGMHATVLSDSILNHHRDIDVVVRGEGEQAICDLAERAMRHTDLSGIAGVSFWKGGKIVHNPDRTLEPDIDRFPMAAHHLVVNSAYQTRSISSSRGCFHRCAFCSIQSQYHHRVRIRGTEKLIEEIGYLADLGARRIMFTDDNFTFSLRRIRELCKGIKEKGFDKRMEFYAEGRMDEISRNPVMAGIMSEAGFRAVYAGAESGSEKIQKYYRKGVETDDILQGVSVCVEQSLTPVVNFILMGPRDTMESVLETVDLAKRVFENGAEIAYAEALIPYPGTPIHDELVRDGKYREKGCVFYFESYGEMKLDWFLQLCNVAREITEMIHGSEKYYETKKAYHELSYLGDMFQRRIPFAFQEYLGRYAGEGAADIKKRMEFLLSQ